MVDAPFRRVNHGVAKVARSKALELYGETRSPPDAAAQRWVMPRQFRMPARLAASLLIASTLLAPHPIVNADETRPHHRPNGFQNNYIEFEPKGLDELPKWKLEASRSGRPQPPATPTPRVTPDAEFIHTNARAGAGAMMQPAITWIGHATMLAQFGGLNLITDPASSERVSPLGIKAWMAERGIANVVELDWWQSHNLDTLAGRVGSFDIALITVGAYEPRCFMSSQHVNPAEAVQIHLDVNAKRSVGIHWGTFELTDESLDEPPKQLAEARRAKGVDDDAFTVMAIGETRRIPRRVP
ncbi:MAG: MBL fold metallo-hydrolase [Burkholderiales bacterium]